MALFYDRDYGHHWNRGYDRGYRGRSGWGDFDRGARMSGERYDRGFKSRWQTDYGDPFNDRASRTPMRMIRGEYRGSDDPGFGWSSNYDRDYSANPMGYDPYFDQPRGREGIGRWNRYDRGYRPRRGSWGMRRGYDEGW